MFPRLLALPLVFALAPTASADTITCGPGPYPFDIGPTQDREEFRTDDFVTSGTQVKVTLRSVDVRQTQPPGPGVMPPPDEFEVQLVCWSDLPDPPMYTYRGGREVMLPASTPLTLVPFDIEPGERCKLAVLFQEPGKAGPYSIQVKGEFEC